MHKILGRLVTWASKKQSLVALPFTEAEYTATVNAAQEMTHLRLLLESPGHAQTQATILNCNQSGVAITKNPVSHAGVRTRHMDVKQHFI